MPTHHSVGSSGGIKGSSCMLPDARIAFFFRLRATSETLAMNNGQNTGLGDEP
jgi:hypothetical protein